MVEGGLRDAGRARGDVDPPDLQPTDHLLKAAPFSAAQQVARGYPCVLHEQLSCLRALVTELVDCPRHRESGRVALDQKGRDSAVPRIGAGVGLGHRQIHVAAVAVGHEQLVAVQQVVVAVARRGGADRLRIGARVGLGDREAALQLSGGEAGQEALLLFVGPVLLDDPAIDHVGVDDPREPHPAPRDLLDHRRIRLERQAESAVGLRKRDPEDAHLAHVAMHRGRKLARVLQRVGERNDLLVDPAPHVADDVHPGLSVAADDLPHIAHRSHTRPSRLRSPHRIRLSLRASSLSAPAEEA